MFRVAQWGIRNPVPINLVMVLVIVLGLATGFVIRRQMFPRFEIDQIVIVTTLEDSSTPEQVDRNISQLIQPRIQNIDGVKKVRSTSNENFSQIVVELLRGFDPARVRDDVKDEVDGITTLPEEAEDPRITIARQYDRAIDIAIYGPNATEMELRDAAELVKQELRSQGLVSRVNLDAPRDFELSISLPLEILESKGLTLQQVAEQIRAYNLELTAGEVKASYLETVIKGEGRKTDFDSIRQIPIRFENGEFLTLQQLAGPQGISDGFVEERIITRYNGQRAAIVNVERGVTEDMIDLCARVREYMAQKTLPGGLQMEAISDMSIYVQQRLDLVIKNGLSGLFLVVLVLTLFLEWRVAFWASSGIAFSMIGAVIILWATDGSLNMLSLFGFVMTTGIIVDDAVVVGEAYFQKKQLGMDGERAASEALKEITSPVIAMMCTTVIAFIPLLYISGLMGKFISALPVVTIAALILSLFESLLILPAHLAHHSGEIKTRFMRFIELALYPFIWLAERAHPHIDRGLNRLIKNWFVPACKVALYHRYSVAVLFMGLQIFLAGLIPAGIVDTALFPKPDAELHIAQVELDKGTPIDRMEAIGEILIEAARRTDQQFAERDGIGPLKQYTFEAGENGSHKGTIIVQLKSTDEGRKTKGQEFLDKWRDNMPAIPDLFSLYFVSAGAGPPAKAIEVFLSSADSATLDRAEKATREYLASVDGVVDISSDNRVGAPTLTVKLKPEFRDLDVTEEDLLRTLSATYLGVKVDTFYRGENEVKTYVRANLSDRVNLAQLKRIRLGNGLTVEQVADLQMTQEAAEIKRIDGLRTLTVQAEVDLSAGANAVDIRAKLEKEWLSLLEGRFPGVRWSYSGEAQEGNEAIESMIQGFVPALLAIYLILGTIFRSYTQPLVIMAAIPFSFVGAILGHLVIGMTFNLLSGFGIIALTGIAVNDSLVLIDCINAYIARGKPLIHALILGAKRRFRPVLLTSLTTCAGMTPILFETSFQAQFLKPMVTSIVFGVLFSTLLILILVPTGYLILMDILKLFERTEDEKATHHGDR